jgi:hypothetical protein
MLMSFKYHKKITWNQQSIMITCHVSVTVTSCEVFGLQYVLLNVLGNCLEEKKRRYIVKNSKRHASKIQGESGFIV